MSEARISVAVDPANTVDDTATERLLRRITQNLVPHLANEVRNDYDDDSPTAFVADGWLADESYVVLRLDTRSSAVELLINTELVGTPLQPWGIGRKIGFVVCMVSGAIVGLVVFHRELASLLGLFGGLMAWLICESVWLAHKRHICAARHIDVESWRAHLVDAVARS